MELRRIITKQIDEQGDGFSLRAAINAVVAVNVDEPGGAAQTVVAEEQEVRTRPTEVPDD